MTKKNEGRAEAAQNETHIKDTTWSRTLDLASGVLIVTITETLDRVFVTSTGAKGRVDEVAKLVRFFEPILAPYEHDPRADRIFKQSLVPDRVRGRNRKPGSRVRRAE